jgi:hypothetical protein
MRRKECVFESVSTKDDSVTSSKTVDAVEDLIPAVLRHQADERIQADDGLFIEMIENGGCQGIAPGSLPC